MSQNDMQANLSREADGPSFMAQNEVIFVSYNIRDCLFVIKIARLCGYNAQNSSIILEITLFRRLIRIVTTAQANHGYSAGVWLYHAPVAQSNRFDWQSYSKCVWIIQYAAQILRLYTTKHIYLLVKEISTNKITD